MDSFALSATAKLLREIPEKDDYATDKLRVAWQLLADAFRHTHLKDPRYEVLRELMTRTQHARYSEPLAFLSFARAVDGDKGAYGAAVDATGFRDEICDQAIRDVADWVASISDRVDDELEAGYLGLMVDATAGDVRRKGLEGIVHFEPGSAEWQMFFDAWQAGEGGVSREQMTNGDPADPARHDRKIVKQTANKLLAILGVRLAPNRPPVLEQVPR